MRRVRPGQTDLQVSPIAFGTWAFGDDWANADLDESRDAIHYVFRGHDEVVRARQMLDPIAEYWTAGCAPAPYRPGTWGPADADRMLSRDRRSRRRL